VCTCDPVVEPKEHVARTSTECGIEWNRPDGTEPINSPGKTPAVNQKQQQSNTLVIAHAPPHGDEPEEKQQRITKKKEKQEDKNKAHVSGWTNVDQPFSS